MQLSFNLVSTGMALPSNVVTSEMIDKRLGMPDGYVRRRSGIKQRYHTEDGLSQSKLASQAVLKACEKAGVSEVDIDLLIAVHAVPEQVIPSTSSMILNQLGWGKEGNGNIKKHIAGFDINASCIGILPALMTANSLISQGVYQRVVIVASEVASRGLNWEDEDSSYIFGDGACALVLDNRNVNSSIDNNVKTKVLTDNKNVLSGDIIAYEMQTFGEHYDKCQIPVGSSFNPTVGVTDKDFYFSMQGKELFKMVAENFEPFVDRVLEKAGISNRQEVDLWIPHQASHLGLQHMIIRMGLDKDKVINIYEDYGNQVSASLPTALHIARESGKLKKGQTVVLLGTGAGVSFGALVWKI